MSTDELERLVATSLQVGDAEPVDLLDGRLRLGQRISQDQRARRLRIVGVAAGLVAVLLTASLLLAGLRDHDETLPVSPPKVTLSPSGLPVGALEGKVQRSVGHVNPNGTEGPPQVATFRLWVRPDGTGSLRNLNDFGAQEPGYEVTFVRLGPGRVALSYDGPICGSPRTVTLDFTIQGRSVTVDDAASDGCILSVVWAADLVGTKLEIQPLLKGL
jgi:hypothetical protein